MSRKVLALFLSWFLKYLKNGKEKLKDGKMLSFREKQSFLKNKKELKKEEMKSTRKGKRSKGKLKN